MPASATSSPSRSVALVALRRTPPAAATPVLANEKFKWFYWIGFILAVEHGALADRARSSATTSRSSAPSTGVARPRDSEATAGDARPRHRGGRGAAAPVPSTTRSTGRSPSRWRAASRSRAARGQLPRRSRCATTSTRSPPRPRRWSPSTPASGRRARRAPRSSTARRGSSANVVVDAQPARAAHRPRRASAWPSSPVAPIGRRVAGTEIGVLLGYVVAARARPVRPARASTTDAGRRRRLLRRPQHPGAREALRVPAARLPALDRDPRGHAPGAVHRRAVDEAATSSRWSKARSSSIDPDPKRLVQALGRAADEFRHGRNPLDDGGLVALFASDEQRGALAEVQALMSLLEGHGNAVMNRARPRARRGAGAHGARAAGRVARARGMAAFVQKLLGLESKMRQYEVGEAFVAAVEREAGPTRHRRGVARPRAPADASTSCRARSTGSPGSTARRARAAAPDAVARPGGPCRADALVERGASPRTSTAPVVVACSGGADSLALLALAADAGLAPVAVHVDHGLRPGARPRPSVVATRSPRASARAFTRGRASAVGRVRTSRPGHATRATPRWTQRAPRSARRACSWAHRRRPGRDGAAQRAARRGASRARAAWRRGTARSSARCSAAARRHARAVRRARARRGRRPDERRPRVPPQSGSATTCCPLLSALARPRPRPGARPPGRRSCAREPSSSTTLAARGVAGPTARRRRALRPRRARRCRWPRRGACAAGSAHRRRRSRRSSGARGGARRAQRPTELAGGRAGARGRPGLLVREPSASVRAVRGPRTRSASIGRRRGRAAARASASSARRSPPTTRADRRCSSACSRARSCS